MYPPPKKIILDHDPFANTPATSVWHSRGTWPAHWISGLGDESPPAVVIYQLRFTLVDTLKTILHIAADECYELFLDGAFVARGSEKGDREHWFFDSFQMTIAPGEHRLTAKVWTLGQHWTPSAQISVSHGFILSTSPGDSALETVATGIAPWQSKQLHGLSFTLPPSWVDSAVPALFLDGTIFDWTAIYGDGDGWMPVSAIKPGRSSAMPMRLEWNERQLHPAIIPAMYSAPIAAQLAMADSKIAKNETPYLLADRDTAIEAEIQRWLAGIAPLQIAPQCRWRVLLNFDNYYCYRFELRVTGGRGSGVSLGGHEALYGNDGAKINRGQIDGQFMITKRNTFIPDGGHGRAFSTPWWHAGRFLELFIETGEEPLIIECLDIQEDRYPLKMEGEFSCNDPAPQRLIPMLVRGLQMCANDSYMDCPFFERSQWIGDTQLQALCGYVMTADDRLQRKALELYAGAVHAHGLVPAFYPGKLTLFIPAFCLSWIRMIYDHAMWRGDRNFSYMLIPAARMVVDSLLRYTNTEGLITSPPGWNYMDWVNGWNSGRPPQVDIEPSASLNWQMVEALSKLADLEIWLGEPELSARWKRIADNLTSQCINAFWIEDDGLFSEFQSTRMFTSHAQCFAINSHRLNHQRQERIVSGLLSRTDVIPMSLWTRHFLFEALSNCERGDLMLNYMQPWNEMLATGLATPSETKLPTRSDCHGWSSTPLFHFFRTLLGIQPGTFGFEEINIQPQLGTINHASGCIPHTNGEIRVELTRMTDHWTGLITLPDGVSGKFFPYGQPFIQLTSGITKINYTQ